MSNKLYKSYTIKKPSNDKIIDLFAKKVGIKSEVCKALSISRPTLDAWISADDALKAAIEAQNESNIDWVESKLFELIEGVTVQEKRGKEEVIYTTAPNVTAIIFYLKTKGKARGYVERQEIAASVTAKEGVFKIAGQEIPFDSKG